jgi:UDP-N-acetylglucosamine 1-carboxyvinyltransferase
LEKLLQAVVQGTTLFFEKMYPGRMFFADYLNGMGANIIIADPHRVVVNGETKLHGGKLYAPDLRAGMAYVAAGLAANGETIVESVEHIDRGYPAIEETLKKLGAHITRIA